MKKVHVLLGNFGSGKTELALHFALRDAASGLKTLLVDIDMVNTYFRVSERRELLRENGVGLISPHYVSSNIETLSLPAEISSAFHSDWESVVFDAGGDGVGATSLGRYSSEFSSLEPSSLEVLFVVNIRRPLAGTAEKASALLREVERTSRLRVTGLINNTNLAHLTTVEELRDGYEVARELSESLALPVSYTAGVPSLLRQFLSEGPDLRYVGEPLFIETHTHRNWDNFTKFGV